MERAYLETVRIQGYGCVRDATLRLTPLHALIGPNDSGKSTVLRAVETLASIVTGGPSTEVSRSFDQAVKQGTFRSTVEVGGRPWVVTASANGFDENLFTTSGELTRPIAFGHSLVSANGLNDFRSQPFSEALGKGARTFRLEARTLRQPTKLIPEGSPTVLDRHGHGLAAAYDAILSRDLESFAAIRERLVALFPTIKQLQLFNASTTTKALRIELTNGTLVDAEYMSEGLLFYLAFAALPYLQPTSILLVEEPENGLHPARIQQVMALLREMSKSTQVILSTHSPLVVNEMQGNEVSVLTRESTVEGTQIRRLNETPRFEERSKVYSLGELWVSYANGSDEGPLLTGGARP